MTLHSIHHEGAPKSILAQHSKDDDVRKALQTVNKKGEHVAQSAGRMSIAERFEKARLAQEQKAQEPSGEVPSNTIAFPRDRVAPTADAQRRVIAQQAEVIDLRRKLFALPDTTSVTPVAVETRRAAREGKVQSGMVLNLPGFGEAKALFFDQDIDTWYFVTPSEFDRVQAALARDESLSMKEAVNYQEAVPMSTQQAIDLGKEQHIQPTEKPLLNDSPSALPPSALHSRYNRSAA